MSKQQNIKVLCRIRPENAKEKESGCTTCIEVTSPTTLRIINTNTNDPSSIPSLASSNNNNSNSNTNTSQPNDNLYTFDHVFPSISNQLDLFTTAALPILKEAFEGVNGTLFCYGQTSSGKTFTMEGIHHDESLKGILPRTMEYIFNEIPQQSSDIEFSVKCSYYQIYNEKIQDLLDTRKTDLAIREDKTKGIWVEDCTEIYVESKEEMYEVFQCGTNNRTVAATEMNKGSSRSHSLFVVTIFQRHVITDSTKTGKIFFVDLAGSEKMSKTGITGGTGLKEAQNINKSLMTLGMVINALTENAQHVPYRDSKLTRVLQESIGGNSLTTLIITCSGNALNQAESLSTLRFGQRAKMIKNKVVANTIKSVKELLLKINELELKLKKYESGLMIGNDTRCSTEGNNNAMGGGFGNKSECDQCNKYSSQVMNLTVELLTLQEELDQLIRDKGELEEELKEKYQEIYELNERNYICEEKDRMIIDDEAKTFKEIQIKLDTFLLFNQKKMLILKGIREAIGSGKNNSHSNRVAQAKKKKEETIDSGGGAKEMIGKIAMSLQELEDLINLDAKNYSEMIELLTGEEYKETNCITITDINNDPNNNNNNRLITSSSDNNNTTNINNNSDDRINSEPNSYRKSNYDSPIKPKLSLTKDNNENLIQTQKTFISELIRNNDQLKHNNEQITLEKYRNEILISKLNDSLAKMSKQLIEKDEAISELNEKIHLNNEKFDDYKHNLLEDFSKKEMKMMDLINKIGDLEEENYKLLNYGKDSNKKKYCLMERQVKQLTIEMQKYLNENESLKGLLNKKEAEMKDLGMKIKDLEMKIIHKIGQGQGQGSGIGHGFNNGQGHRQRQSNNSLNKVKGIISDDVSSYLNANSSFCTPMTGNHKNFKVTTVNDLLRQHLIMGGIDSGLGIGTGTGSGSGKDLDKNNISGLTEIRKPSFHNIHHNADNSPIICRLENKIDKKIIKIIKGGNKNDKKPDFFHKMLSNGKNSIEEPIQSKDFDLIQRKATEKLNRQAEENELDNLYDDASSFF